MVRPTAALDGPLEAQLQGPTVGHREHDATFWMSGNRLAGLTTLDGARQGVRPLWSAERIGHGHEAPTFGASLPGGHPFPISKGDRIQSKRGPSWSPRSTDCYRCRTRGRRFARRLGWNVRHGASAANPRRAPFPAR